VGARISCPIIIMLKWLPAASRMLKEYTVQGIGVEHIKSACALSVRAVRGVVMLEL
jgi:hypothetical protein